MILNSPLFHCHELVQAEVSTNDKGFPVASGALDIDGAFHCRWRVYFVFKGGVFFLVGHCAAELETMAVASCLVDCRATLTFFVLRSCNLHKQWLVLRQIVL